MSDGAEEEASCVVCGIDEDIKLCSGCEAVYYCSTDCQKVDRSRHRKQDGCGRRKQAHVQNADADDVLKDQSKQGNPDHGAQGVMALGMAHEWKPSGVPTLFPSRDMPITPTTPMGRPLEIFGGNGNADRSFASNDMMITDLVEMSLWLAARIGNFNSDLGKEVEPLLVRGQDVDRMVRTGVPTGSGGHRPQILYIAGVEGTGHHGVGPLINYPAVLKYGSGVLTWWRSLREVLWKTPPRERKGRLRQLMNAMKINSRPHIIIECASWPFGEENRARWEKGCFDSEALAREKRSGNPGNSTDLKEFVELFQEYGDVKVLLLHRSLVSAAWSHKEWDAGLVEHASVLALFAEYLTQVVGGLSPGSWRWVAYEDLCDAHKRGDFGAIEPLANFLGLEARALTKSFESFRPSSKDASKDMSPDNLAAIKALEKEHLGRWFPDLFPEQRLLVKKSTGAPPRELVPKTQAALANRSYDAPPKKLLAKQPALLAEDGSWKPTREIVSESIDRHEGADANWKLAQFMESLDEKQQQVWLEANSTNGASEQTRQNVSKRLEESLSADQKFLLGKAMLHEQVIQSIGKADINPSQFTCMHMWIQGCGFGSEINNLISAAIFCEVNGLPCVVEDDNWNAGRLHNYLQVEPLIHRHCPHAGRCLPLDVMRDKGIATPGWFSVLKHSMGVSLKSKAQHAQRLWRYTVDTERVIEELNQELDLPVFYMAVQIRRGDKVFKPSGARGGETLPIPLSEYARSALSHFQWPCTAIAVSSDDATAAEEFAVEIKKLRADVDVRFRSRKDVPEDLRSGHWQKKWNALPLEARVSLTHEFLADVEVMRSSHVFICTQSSNVARLVTLLRDGLTVSLDEAWTHT